MAVGHKDNPIWYIPIRFIATHAYRYKKLEKNIIIELN